MGKIIGYIQAESEGDRIMQKATIDSYAKNKFNVSDVEYVVEEVSSYISWKNRILSKEVLPNMEEGDVLLVHNAGRLGNSSAEVNLLLMYFADKGVDVYEAKTGAKIAY